MRKDSTRTARRGSRRTFLKSAGGLAAGIALAGCMGGPDGGDDTLTVGASAALTGSYSQEGTWTERGYQVWVHTLNESGGFLGSSDETGLLGQEVELITYDDESDPSRAVNLYQRLIEEDDVDLLIGPYSSAVSSAVIPVIEGAQMASIFPMMSDTSVLLERDVNFITQGIAPANTYLVGAIDIAAANGAETAAIAYEDTAFPTNAIEGHVPYIEEQGIEVIHQESYPTETEDYTPMLNPAQGEEPDIVLGGGYTPDAIGLTRASQSLDLSAGIFSWMVGGMLPAFYDAVDDAALGMTGDMFWSESFQLPYSDELVDTAIETLDNVNDGNFQYHLAGGFAGGLVLERAIKNVGEIDQEAIAEELHAIDTRESDFGIPFGNGHYAVDDNGVQIAQVPSLGQWQEQDDGGLGEEVVYPEEARTADPIYPHPGW